MSVSMRSANTVTASEAHSLGGNCRSASRPFLSRWGGRFLCSQWQSIHASPLWHLSAANKRHGLLQSSGCPLLPGLQQRGCREARDGLREVLLDVGGGAQPEIMSFNTFTMDSAGRPLLVVRATNARSAAPGVRSASAQLSESCFTYTCSGAKYPPSALRSALRMGQDLDR